jgi:steroid delta-isomerase-like uncharacterized protein
MLIRDRHTAAGRTVLAIGILAAALGVGRATAQNPPGAGIEANKKAMIKVYEVLGNGKVEELDKYIDSGMIDHQAMPGFPSGLSGFKQFVKAMREAFPDFQVRVDDTIAAGDQVVCRITMSGTQKGPWMGAPASGKSFSMQAIDIVRFKDGKAVEHWGNEDDLGMMQQLGMNPGDAGGAPMSK